uniref:3'-5' exonuclease domain-containing protein n=1 Tax=Caenorhabditis japonica TaxID=281687 RepID=A0A8R1HWL5_CAEJA
MEEPRPSGRPKMTKAEKKAFFRTDYIEPIKSRREWLKTIMNGPESEREHRARQAFFKFFDKDHLSGVNMYGMTVDMIKAMPDRGKTAGQNLSVWYLEDFKTWLQDSGIEDQLRTQYLSSSIKMSALENGMPNQKALISEIFDISSDQLKSEVVKLFRTAIKKNDFANAAKLALQYKLTDYTFNELIVPLVLSGKEITAYELLENQPEMQKRLVKFLDDLVLLAPAEVDNVLNKYRNNVQNIVTERFLSKAPLARLIKNVVERQDFDPNLLQYAKNYETNLHVNAIKYYITERYKKDGVADDQYFQHMQCLVDASGVVRENIIFFLWDSKDREKQVDAISWAIFLGIDQPTSIEIPGLMRDFFREPDGKLQDARKLLQNRKECCIPLEGKQLYVFEEERKYPIYMVKTEESLSQLSSQLRYLEQDPDPVYLGFDSEWKPGHMTEMNSMKIAIMQLFFQNTVWLVDCVELEKLSVPVKDETWQKFARRLLGSTKIKVIGFDMRNDLDAFLTIPALKYTLKIDDIKNTWCAKKLTENVCDIDMEILGLTKKTFKLADLTHTLLGRELDKTEQCSNWKFRPLRQKQIVYAAMDAVVVVETFQKVLEKAEEANTFLDVHKLMSESNVMAPKKEKNKRDCRKLNTIPWAELYQELYDKRDVTKPLQQPVDVQVIVDTMLLGFGKNLRRLGVDVYIPRDVSDFREKLKLMARLGGDLQRHIITVPSKSFEALKVEYQRYMTAIEDLNTMSAEKQLISFLSRFNIELRPEVHFHRCIECNSMRLIKFPSPILHFLHQYCIVFVQNVFAADRDQFPLEYWWGEMLKIDPRQYDGIEVKMTRPHPTSNWIVATVPTGCLHITRNTAIHNNLPEGVEVRIHKVPDDEFKRPNLCFFVCGDCGTVHYDGRTQYASNGPITE